MSTCVLLFQAQDSWYINEHTHAIFKCECALYKIYDLNELCSMEKHGLSLNYFNDFEQKYIILPMKTKNKALENIE